MSATFQSAFQKQDESATIISQKIHYLLSINCAFAKLFGKGTVNGQQVMDFLRKLLWHFHLVFEMPIEKLLTQFLDALASLESTLLIKWVSE